MSASDSDDDKPLMELIRKRKAQVSAEAISSAQKKKEKDDAPVAKKVKTEPSTTAAKKPVVKEEKSSSKTSSSSSSKPTASRTSSSSSAQYSQDFYETDKGQMVQRLLCRWWYAITWPKPEDIGAAPAGYEALDGFPGVFICTSSENLGKILDTRNKETCPSLKNISQWSSERIQKTCITALEEQMRILAETEGEDSSLYRSLKRALRETKSVDPVKADREARKFDFTNR